MQVPAADDRRTPGNKFMQSLGREHCADAYPKGLWEVLSAWPVFNHHTVMACPPRQTPPCSTGPRRTTASTYDTAAMLAAAPKNRTGQHAEPPTACSSSFALADSGAPLHSTPSLPAGLLGSDVRGRRNLPELRLELNSVRSPAVRPALASAALPVAPKWPLGLYWALAPADQLGLIATCNLQDWRNHCGAICIMALVLWPHTSLVRPCFRVAARRARELGRF